MKLVLIVLSLIVSFSVNAKKNDTKKSSRNPANLAHFKAGDYKLDTGDIRLCGDGEFELRNDNTNVGLGPFHGFNLKNEKGSLPGDAPGEENCIYNYENKMVVKSQTTELVFSEKKVCGGELKHTLTKEAFIGEKNISLNVTQEGNAARTYNCLWKIKK